MYRLSVLIATLLLICACNGKQSSTTQDSNDSTAADSTDFALPVSLQYAEQMAIINKPTHKEVYLLAPDSKDTIARYALYPRTKTKPQGLDVRFTPIAVPITSIACSSTTQIGALGALGKEDALVAGSSLNNISNPKIRQRIEAGEVAEIVRGSSRNNELLVALKPEVFLMDFSDQKEQDEELHQAGIEPILFNSWKETTLLGRAEWIKLTGMLLGENRLADSLFRQMTEEYKATQALIPQDADTIQILYGADYKGLWYIPGEYSYATRMLADAKVRYDYMPGIISSTPVNFEYVFSRHRHDRIWLSVMVGQGNSLKDFLALNERYSAFDAVSTGEVWLDRKRINEYGGNDYWESGPYKPQLILKDIIKITRPELLPNYETTYFIQLR